MPAINTVFVVFILFLPLILICVYSVWMYGKYRIKQLFYSKKYHERGYNSGVVGSSHFEDPPPVTVIDFSTSSTGAHDVDRNTNVSVKFNTGHHHNRQSNNGTLEHDKMLEVFPLFGRQKLRSKKIKRMQSVTLAIIVVEILVVCFLIVTMNVRIWKPEYADVDLPHFANTHSDAMVTVPPYFLEECCAPTISKKSDIFTTDVHPNDSLARGFVGNDHYVLVRNLEIQNGGGNGSSTDTRLTPVCCVCSMKSRSTGVSTDNVGILASLILLSALVQRSLHMESIFLFSTMTLIVVIITYGQQLALINRDLYHILSNFPGGNAYFNCIFVTTRYQKTQPTTWFFLVYLSLKSFFSFMAFTIYFLYTRYK